MTYSQAYFTLSWTSGSTPYSLKFRLLVEGADPAGELDLTGVRRDLAGYLNTVRVPFSPKVLEGVIPIHPVEETGYGTLAELRLAWDRAVSQPDLPALGGRHALVGLLVWGLEAHPGR